MPVEDDGGLTMMDCLLRTADLANDLSHFGHKKCGYPQLCSNGIAARLRRLVFINDRNANGTWYLSAVDTHGRSLLDREHVVGRIRL